MQKNKLRMPLSLSDQWKELPDSRVPTIIVDCHYAARAAAVVALTRKLTNENYSMVSG